MPSWPTALPVPLVEAVTYESAENVIRTQMDAGLPKMRRRFTSVPETASFRLLLTRDQVQVLQDFVTITLSDVLSFTWREFRLPDGAFSDDTTNTATYRFLGRPRFAPASSGLLWYADISLEILSSSLTRSLTNQEIDATTGERIPPILDLFIIVGQSNAEGRGDSTESPAAPYGVEVDAGVITSPLADPVGGASTGSMWPAFSNEWWVQTARRSAFVESATGGTALLPDTAGSNWSPSGTLRAAAVSAANTAIAAINASDDYTLGNVYFVWSQGEQDATNINGTTITGPLYEQALEDLAAYFKAQVPEMVSMAVIQTAANLNDPSYDDGYAEIRAAQEDACADSANLTMAYRGTLSFLARFFMSDSVHYTQDGLNLAGKCAARGLNSAPATPAPPQVLAATAYADSSYTAVAGRSANHTTAAGTKTIVVALSYMRPESNTTFFVDSVTFGGIALTKVRDEKASQSAAALGRVNSSLWYIDETAYGSSLSGVTASLAVVDASAGNIIDWAVIDLDVECVPEDWRFDAATPADKTTGTVDLYTSAPTAVVGVCSSAASAAAPLTATLTNLTEAMDHGLSNTGNTRTGQMAVGWAEESALVTGKTYSCQWTATCTALAWVVAAFREKISGE